MRCYAMLCYAMLCGVMWCYVVLCCSITLPHLHHVICQGRTCYNVHYVVQYYLMLDNIIYMIIIFCFILYFFILFLPPSLVASYRSPLSFDTTALYCTGRTYGGIFLHWSGLHISYIPVSGNINRILIWMLWVANATCTISFFDFLFTVRSTLIFCGINIFPFFSFELFGSLYFVWYVLFYSDRSQSCPSIKVFYLFSSLPWLKQLVGMLPIKPLI